MIWAFAGFSVGITAFFCIFFAQFGADQPFFEANRFIIAGVVLALGLTLWFVGGHKKRKAVQAAAEQGESAEPSEEGETKSGFPITLFSMQHWAILCTILSVCIIYIQPWKTVIKQQVHVTALQRLEKKPPPPRKPDPTNLAAKLDPPQPRKIKLQGIVFRDKNPSAIINGRTFYVGDMVEGTKVLSVERQVVTISIDGETRSLLLR